MKSCHLDVDVPDKIRQDLVLKTSTFTSTACSQVWELSFFKSHYGGINGWL